MQGVLDSLKLGISSVKFSPGLIQAVVIVALIFLLLLVMARLSRSYISWYTSGWYIWVGLGFVLAVVIEGFFVVSGSTVFTAILGMQNAPKPIQTVIDGGRSRLKNVLGAEDKSLTPETVIWDYGSLDNNSQEKVKSFVCKEE